MRSGPGGGGGGGVNTQRANVWPAGQGSTVTKIAQKTAYLLPNSEWQIAATAMDKELNTRQDVLLVQLGRTKLQLTGSF